MLAGLHLESSFKSAEFEIATKLGVAEALSAGGH